MDIKIIKKSIELIHKERHITSKVFVHEEGDTDFTKKCKKSLVTCWAQNKKKNLSL